MFSFDPNPEWTTFYASGPEILAYIKRTVKKWDLDRDLQLKTEVVGPWWKEDLGMWKVTVECAGELRSEYCHVLIASQGVFVLFETLPTGPSGYTTNKNWQYRHESWPDIQGLRDFKGHLTHSASWDDCYDCSNKTLAVIGNSASGIQIVPEMAKVPGTEVRNFIRGPAWVYNRASLSGTGDPSFTYSEEEKEHFRNREHHLQYRKGILDRTETAFSIFTKGPNNEEAMRLAAAQMPEKLKYNKELCEKLIPTWELGCHRITTGPGYLESFLRPNCHLTNSPITQISENAVHTADGKVYECDVST